MAKGVGWGAANKNYKHDQQATRLLQWITIMNIEGRKFCTMIAVIAHKYHQSKGPARVGDHSPNIGKQVTWRKRVLSRT